MYTSSALLLSSIVSSAYAAPLFGISLSSSSTSSTTTPLSVSQINSTLVRPGQLSQVAYCSSATVLTLTCGAPCDALGAGNVNVTQVGGNDGTVPMYYIAVDKTLNSVVVSHQGTDPENILSIANDLQFLPTALNASRFPNQPTDNILVHDGFQQTFERTADGVLAGVQQAMSANSLTNVLVTGHSLGAAVASLDAMMLKLSLPAGTQVTTTVFGLPRVGNSEWADFVDNTLGTSFVHVSNQNDPVPTVPPEFIGYVHPSGEVHITKDESESDGSDGGIVACDGTENSACSDGNSLLDVSVDDHLGPYFDNIGFGASNCPN